MEAASYDDQIAAYWDDIIGRIIEATQHRLRAEGLSADEATATATALVWMNERTCYQQAVRGETGLDDDRTIAALSEVWWGVILVARAAR